MESDAGLLTQRIVRRQCCIEPLLGGGDRVFQCLDAGEIVVGQAGAAADLADALARQRLAACFERRFCLIQRLLGVCNLGVGFIGLWRGLRCIVTALYRGHDIQRRQLDLLHLGCAGRRFVAVNDAPVRHDGAVDIRLLLCRCHQRYGRQHKRANGFHAVNLETKWQIVKTNCSGACCIN